jgi:hypothetical protein
MPVLTAAAWLCTALLHTGTDRLRAQGTVGNMCTDILHCFCLCATTVALQELREKDEQIDIFRCELDMLLASAHVALTKSSDTTATAAAATAAVHDKNASNATVNSNAYGIGY